MKKMLSVTLIAVMIATACIFAVGCGQTTPPDTTPGTSATATSYVVMDINPTVELTVTEENVVATVTASNDDAKVLLNAAEVEGKTLEEAAELLADASVELGFIKEGENAEISITVVGDTEEIEEQVFKKIKDKFSTHIQEKYNFHLGVARDLLLSYETELNALKEANPENEAIQALSIARYRMIVSAMEKDSTLTLEAALALETRELVRIIHEAAHKQMHEDFEKLEIEAEYEMQKIKDKVYAEMGGFMQLEGVQLAALRGVEFQIELLEECDLKAYLTLNLTEENVRQVAALLGLNEEETTAFVEKCIGLDGTYSVHNMKFAINRLYRNIPAEERAAFGDKYELVEDYIETLEEAVPVPAALVTLLGEYVKSYNAIPGVTPITMPAAFATMEELDTFLETVEETLENEIERIEEALEAQIKAAGLEEKFDQKMNELEGEMDAKEEEMEREHDRLKGEHEDALRGYINGWINRHNDGGKQNP